MHGAFYVIFLNVELLLKCPEVLMLVYIDCTRTVQARWWSRRCVRGANW
jgi:hypothetical protein